MTGPVQGAGHKEHCAGPQSVPLESSLYPDAGRICAGISLFQEAKLELESYAHHVAQLVNKGKSFTMIERTINAWPLNEEQRGTLWLYAWSLQSTVRQRRKNRVPGHHLGTE